MEPTIRYRDGPAVENGVEEAGRPQKAVKVSEAFEVRGHFQQELVGKR
jgi:hypothetical protein